MDFSSFLIVLDVYVLIIHGVGCCRERSAYFTSTLLSSSRTSRRQALSNYHKKNKSFLHEDIRYDFQCILFSAA